LFFLAGGWACGLGASCAFGNPAHADADQDFFSSSSRRTDVRPIFNRRAISDLLIAAKNRSLAEPVWPENSIYQKQREIIPGVVDNEMIRCQSAGPVPFPADLSGGLDEPAMADLNPPDQATQS